MRNHKLLLVCLVLTFRGLARAGDDVELLGVTRIWDQAPHNAFTSLVRFQDHWLCAFREASAHVGKDIEGKMRVISSDDAEHWDSVTLLSDPRGDIRDAKLSITPSGELMLLTATRLRAPGPSHQSIAWFTKDLKTWEGPVDVGEANIWQWGICWHKGTGYSIGYGTTADRYVRLYKTTDGRHFEKVVDRFAISAPFPNENAMVFDAQDVAHVLLRCDPDNGFIGQAAAPYTDWAWKQTDARVGGPALMLTEGGKLLGGGRLHEPQVHTSLFWVDPEKATLTECCKLPSSGDTSYPGLVFHDGILYASYYSSHETKTSIYLARCKLPAARAQASKLNEILVSALQKRGSFISVHAAEDLIALGQTEAVCAAFEPQAKDAQPPYRIGVWRVLARSMPDESQRAKFVEQIRSVLLDPQTSDRVHAMEALAKLNVKINDGAERALVEQVAAQNDGASPFAVWRLVQAGDAKAAATLVKMLQSSDEVTRSRAAGALAWLNIKTPEANEALAAALQRESAASTARALMAVALGGDSVTKMLTDPVPGARYQAAMYLSKHGNSRDVDALGHLIEDPDPDVQAAAAFALLRIDQQTPSTANATQESRR